MPTRRLRYVNTNSTAGGNGTTNDTAGANRAYPSLANAISSEPSTLISSDEYLEIQCTGGTDANVSQVSFGSIPTDSTHYILVTAAPGQEAEIPINRNKYVFSGSLFLAQTTAIRIDKLQFDQSGSNAAIVLDNTSITRSIYITNNTIYQRGTGYGLHMSPGDSSSAYIVNNFISASSTAAAGMLTQTTNGSFVTHSIYNNTVVGGVRNYFTTFYGANDTFNFKNNLGVSGSTSCFYRETTATVENVENNASSDTSGPANTVGGATFRSRPFKFRNVSTGDYRLAGNDTGARKIGVNLSTDAYYPFSTDFSGQDRNRNTFWDIGADQSNVGFGEVEKTTTFFDNFNRADGSIGSNYVTMVTGSGLPLAITNNQINASSGVSNIEISLSSISSSVATFSSDQQAIIRYTAISGFDFGGPAVRVDPINGNGYILFLDGVDAPGRRITRLDGGVRTNIGANVGIVPNVGDVFTLRAVGSLISAYRNGILVASASDATYTTGQPGVFYKKENNNGTLMDNFIAANVSTTGGSLVIMTNTGSRGLVVGVT